MKNRVIYIIWIVLSGLLFGQNSLLSLNGYGEYMNTYDASSLSLGESRMFSDNFNGISLSSSSSLSKFNSSYLAMTVSFNEHNADRLSKVNSNILHLISYTFPISKSSLFSFGMNPVFRSDMSVQETEFQIFGANDSPIDTDSDGINDPVAYNTYYDFSGGISEFYGSFSSKIGNNFNLGLKFGKLFGSSIRASSLRFYEINYFQDGSIPDFNLFSSQNSTNSYEYSSYNYEIDLRFSIPNINFDNEFVIIYGSSDKMNVKVDFDNSSTSQNFSSLNGMSNLGVGFKSDIFDDFGLIFELNNFKAYKSDHLLNIFNNDYPDISSAHIGFYNTIDDFAFRSGLCYKKYILESKDVIDLGITFGFGVKYLNKNSFNFGLKLGERRSDFYNLHDEKYFKLYITLISSEDWFIKKRK